MARDDIPNEILNFLHECIDSVEQLRVLLLLSDNPVRVWTVTELTKELRSTETSIQKRLDDLYSRGVLARDSSLAGKHRFNPSSEDMRTLVKSLEQINQARPYRVIDAIFSRPSEALKAFADAFKFRGGK